MKNIFKSFAFALLAVAVSGCSNDGIDENITNIDAKQTITVVANTAETRTTLNDDRNKLVWSDGDQFGVYTDKGDKNLGSDEYAADVTDYTFEVTSGTTKIYAYYPYYYGNKDAEVTAVSVGMSASQTQAKGGELNGEHYPMVAQGTVDKGVATLTFEPVACALALNIYGAEGDDAAAYTVKSVKFASSVDMCGYYNQDLGAEPFEYVCGEEQSATVTLTTGVAANGTKPADKKMYDNQIYLVVAKAAYPAGSTFEVKMEDGTIYTFTSTAAIDCSANDIYAMNLNLANQNVVKTKEVFTLLTDASQLAAGDEIVIAAAESDFALSATQSNNNRAEVAITKSANTIIINSDVEVLAVEAGTKTGTFAFKADEGYLYAASSGSNHMKSEAEKSDNSSWTVTIAADGVATVKAQGTNSRNWMRHNATSHIFSCYGSGQKDICIYKKGIVKDYTPLATPDVIADATGNQVTVVWESVPYADSYLVSFDPNDLAVQTVPGTDADQDGLFTKTYELLASTAYTVSVTAVPAEGAEYNQSEPGTATVTTEAASKKDASVKEMIAWAEAENEALATENNTTVALDNFAQNIVGYIAANSGTKNGVNNMKNMLSVVDNTGEAGTGIMIYKYDGFLNDAYPVGKKVSIALSGVTIKNYNNLYELMDATVTVLEEESATIVVPEISVAEFNTGDYMGMKVKVKNVKTAGGGEWQNNYSNITHNLSDATTYDVLAVYVAQGATDFSSLEYDAKTGDIVGVASCYKTTKQLLPTCAEDVAAFNITDPKIETTSSPNQFAAEGGSQDITFEVKNQGNNNVYAKVDGEGFTATISGTTVTVTAAANANATERTATLTLFLGLSANYDDAVAESTPITLTQAAQGAAIESQIYTTGFEKTEGFETSTTYNNTTANVQGPTGKQWSTVFGTPSTSSAISNVSIAMRYYYNKADLGYTQTEFNLPKVTKVTYKAKVSNIALKLDTYYSTDGGSTWTVVDSGKALTTSATEYSFTVSESGEYANVRIKFAISSASTQPSSKNYQLTIDDVTVYGIAE